jgi:hypothetical protein
MTDNRPAFFAAIKRLYVDSRDVSGFCMTVALAALFTYVALFLLVSCTPTQKTLTIVSIDRAHLIIENAHLQASLDCIKTHGRADVGVVEDCWADVDMRFEEYWHLYDQARQAAILEEAAEPFYCELAKSVPKLPTEVCGE